MSGDRDYTTSSTGKPNPGSRLAVEMGCRCPVLDNAHGAGARFGRPGEFWITETCPLHGNPSTLTPKEPT